MKNRILLSMLLLWPALGRVYGQCGFLAGKVTDLSGSVSLAANISAKTDQGKVKLGKADSSGAFNVELPCHISVISVEAPRYQTLHVPLNCDEKPEGTFFVAFGLAPQEKQTIDEPYAQSGQQHFELRDSTRTDASVIRKIQVQDAVTGRGVPAEVCLYFTQKQKKECFTLSGAGPSAEIVFTEKDIVALEVKSAGYQAYNGNLILDKTDQEPRTYTIRLHRQRSLLSVNILNARAGLHCQLIAENRSVIPLYQVNEGHYYAEVTPGKSYRFGITSGEKDPELNTAVASLKEGITLKSFRLPELVFKKTEELPAAPKISVGEKTLYFARSDYKLPAQSRDYLDSLASFMQASQGKGLRITGHTDNVGNPELNRTLSEYRVRVIARYLVEKGVPENMISSAGLGSKYPVVPNDTEENRRKNRRVEVQIIDLQQTSN